MPLDEFGRVIPASNKQQQSSTSSSHYRSSRPRPTRGSHPFQHPSENYSDGPMLCEFVWKDEKTGDDYESYRKDYCLNFVKNFFNRHIDDSWFRQEYSPLARYNAGRQERQRAQNEAKVLFESVKSNPTTFLENVKLGYGTKEQTSLSIPSSHALSIEAIHVKDIPPFVSDDQLRLALLDHCTLRTDKDVQVKIFSATPQTTNRNFLYREAFCVLDNEARLNIMRNLHRNDVPRKEDETVPIVVECSDPYGRLEVDADGKGKAPPDGLPVPTRKVAVMVGYTRPPTIQVLSAALSSTKRFESDREAAISIASALDEYQQIPNDCRLESVLSTIESDSVEDQLDTAIAYLRRVHLFSFYNGCKRAERTGDVMAGRHASIHLRLQNADSLLESIAEQAGTTAAEEEAPKTEGDEAEGTTPAPKPAKDLLVQRLDDSIQEALDKIEGLKSSGEYIISKEVDEQANDLLKKEESVEPDWIANHFINDEGRARCSFHFCHKLFKDSSFLNKHLLKKHKEFLVAEQAKVHDDAMMDAWEKADSRPWLPKVRVDCGASFGLVESSIVMVDDSPIAEDPEPDLWKKEEERRQREAEMRQRREELRREQRQSEKREFVDVDDMKEEKVEVNFDVVLPLKKKKKRKLL